MAWSDWSEFDTANAIGGALGDQLEKSGEFFRNTAKDLQAQAGQSAARAQKVRASVQELQTLTDAALRDLDAVDRKRLEAKTQAGIQTIRSELGKAQGFLRSADENIVIGKNLNALGRNLGAIVGAAELLYKLKNPDLSVYSFGETGAGFIGGVICGSLALLVPPLAPLGSLVGIAGAFAGKYLWEKHIAPQLGWSEKDSPRFWDSVFEALGVGQPEKAVFGPREMEPRPIDGVPMRLALAKGGHYPYPAISQIGRLSLKSRSAERSEYTVFDIDPDLMRYQVESVTNLPLSEHDKYRIERTLRLVDSNADDRLDAGDDLFRNLTIWRDKPELGIYGFDELEWFKSQDVIWIDRSFWQHTEKEPATATGGAKREPEAFDLNAIEARHGTSFTRYFDDVLGGAGETGDAVDAPGLPSLKAYFEQALKDDPAVGLADLIDFATLLGPAC